MIKKLSKGLYYVEVYLGRDKITGKKLRKTKRCKTLKEAKEFEMKCKQGNTIKRPKTMLTVSEYLQYWFDNYATVNCRIQTQASYKVLIKSINEKIGTISVHDLNQRDIDKMYAEMSKEIKIFKNGKSKRRYAYWNSNHRI